MSCEETFFFSIRHMPSLIMVKYSFKKNIISGDFSRILGLHLDAKHLSRKSKNSIPGRTFLSNLP
jgi:hypothetical protein